MHKGASKAKMGVDYIIAQMFGENGFGLLEVFGFGFEIGLLEPILVNHIAHQEEPQLCISNGSPLEGFHNWSQWLSCIVQEQRELFSFAGLDFTRGAQVSEVSIVIPRY
jgi:hypothetical protein